MGTGIVATAGVTLPVQVPGQRTAALVVWVGAAVLLLVTAVATAAHWARHRAGSCAPRPPGDEPLLRRPAMALLTVGAGALLLGGPCSARAAGRPRRVLWASAPSWACHRGRCALPRFTRARLRPGCAFGGWLMPVVPPMVRRRHRPLLVPYPPPGQPRGPCCWPATTLFGPPLLASLVVISLIWGPPGAARDRAAAAVPTLWIVLGPSASRHRGRVEGNAAATCCRRRTPAAPRPRLFYGLAACGFALSGSSLAAAVTSAPLRHPCRSRCLVVLHLPRRHPCHRHLGLAARTGLGLFGAAAVALYLFLLGAWAIVSVRTVRGAASGRLPLPPLHRCAPSVARRSPTGPGPVRWGAARRATPPSGTVSDRRPPRRRRPAGRPRGRPGPPGC